MWRDSFQAVRARLGARQLAAGDLFACAEELDRVAGEAQAQGGAVRRIALAGDLTLDFLRQAIACAVALEGDLVCFYLVPYGALHQECLDRASGLHAFRPEVTVLIPDWRHVTPPMPADATHDAVRTAQQAQLDRFEAIWSALGTLRCAVIQHLLVAPVRHWRGPAERCLPAAVSRRVQTLNEAMLQHGQGRVVWLEADRLAADVGLSAWAPERFHYAGRLPCDPRFLAAYLPWFRGAWRTATGRARKALVLDLDDTLWGGTIGDDGVDEIVLGPDHGARGEAFAQWQRYIAELGQRGVVLAACSKNDARVAATGFDHAFSVLRRQDFAAFACSWGDKAAGLRQLAEELNLGLDALVFADDNPAECALVRQCLPQVEVVELGTDPAQFIDRLDAGHWFDQQDYTHADHGRAAAYAARAEARAEQAETVDLPSYLRGLEMVGQLAVAQAADLPRLAQMEMKTNQFNLTTRRHTQAQLDQWMSRPDRLLLTLRLKDRFGDHGLVSSLVVAREGEVLRIDGWLMSCRVFARTAEQFMLLGLERLGRELGAVALLGEYLPTSRNAVVADLYLRLGFVPVSADGRWWRRELTATSDHVTWITPVEQA